MERWVSKKKSDVILSCIFLGFVLRSLDYLHGTGHGVGSYLNVHEEPIGISWKPHPDDPGLQPGMFLSNGM